MAVRFHGLKEDEANLLKSLQQGGEVTVGLVPVPPYVMDCFGQNSCHRPGLGVELVKEVCHALAINCHLIKETDTKFGDNFTLGNGEWQGMIRYIMDQKYNTSMPSFNPTASRLDVVDFSISVYDDITSMVTRFPPANPPSLTSLIMFQYEVIFLIITTFFVIGYLGLLFDIVKYEIHSNSFQCRVSCSLKHWFKAFIDTIDAASVLFQQAPSEKRSHSVAYYVLFSVWGLCCVVLAEMYISFILAGAFTIERDLPFWDIETLSNCIQSQNCKMIAKTTSTSYYERIFNAEDGSVLLLKNALEQHPTVIIKKGTEQGSMIVNDDEIYNVIILSSAQYSQMVQDHATCSFDHIRIQTYDPLAFPFHKGSNIRPLFEQAIILLREAGVIQELYHKYVGEHINNDQCRASIIGAETIALNTFSGAFLALLIGCIIGGAAFVLEKFTASKK